MKRIAFTIACLCLLVTLGFGKQKITRVIQELDYKDYGKGMFRRVTTDLYKQALSGKIKGYRDSTLKQEYSLKEIKKQGLTWEKINYQSQTNALETRDSTIYLDLDPDNTQFWLEVQEGSRQKNQFSNKPIALCFRGNGLGKILYYCNYDDLKDWDYEEKNFLDQCLNLFEAYGNYTAQNWRIIDESTAQQFVLKQFVNALNTLKTATYARIKIYTSDTMNTVYDSLSFQKKKDYFLDYGQNLDTYTTMGIILIQEFNRTTDTTSTINENAIGLCANIKLNGIQLYNVPLYYMKYQDTRIITMLSSSSSSGESIDFLRMVSDYQLLNRSSDNPLNSN